MNHQNMTVLVIGATGSIGQHVVTGLVQKGCNVKALVRSRTKAAQLPAGVIACIGDLTIADSLARAVTDIDAVVFTHGSDGQGRAGSETIDYGGVLNILLALRGRRVRIALMTSIGVTHHDGRHNQVTHAHDWKRRSERLVRASGHPYTIVRPGWFDYNAAGQHTLHMLQGDGRHAGDPSDGVVSRMQLAQVLVDSLACDEAVGRTFELVAEAGQGQPSLDPLFGALRRDVPGALDGVADNDTLPMESEPDTVRRDLQAVTAAP